MSFSHSQGVHINRRSCFEAQGDVHVYSSPFAGDVHMYVEGYDDEEAVNVVPVHFSSESGRMLWTSTDRPVIPVLPPRPRLVIGRDREVNYLVRALLHTVAPRLAIVGPGGIGKTTLALAVLHDERVSARWKSKIYFVNCEGVTSRELLVKKIADVLRIHTNPRKFNAFNTVLQALAGDPAVLCLDNFETPWEGLDLWPSRESVLQQLSQIQDLALLVTMRGIQRPAFSSIKWSASLEPLKQLDFQDAKLLFKILSNRMDEWSKKLIRAVYCIPLAVTLLAQIISERTETTQSLWNRWMTESTAVVANGGQDRLSQLDTSNQLSVSKVDDLACQIYRMIALLSSGRSSFEPSSMPVRAMRVKRTTVHRSRNLTLVSSELSPGFVPQSSRPAMYSVNSSHVFSGNELDGPLSEQPSISPPTAISLHRREESDEPLNSDLPSSSALDSLAGAPPFEIPVVYVAYEPRSEHMERHHARNESSAFGGLSFQHRGYRTDNIRRLVARLSTVLRDVTQYKQLLRCRGLRAQQLLDIFQTLLDTPDLDAGFRRGLVVALQRLSRCAELYPTCYTLGGIELVDQDPIAAGSFADIYKGKVRGQTVCLKVMRLYQRSDVNSFLKGGLSHVTKSNMLNTC